MKERTVTIVMHVPSTLATFPLEFAFTLLLCALMSILAQKKLATKLKDVFTLQNTISKLLLNKTNAITMLAIA